MKKILSSLGEILLAGSLVSTIITLEKNLNFIFVGLSVGIFILGLELLVDKKIKDMKEKIAGELKEK